MHRRTATRNSARDTRLASGYLREDVLDEVLAFAPLDLPEAPESWEPLRKRHGRDW